MGEGVAQTEELKKCHVPNQIIIQEIDRGNAHILCVYSCTRIYVCMIPYGQTYVYSIQDIYIYISIYIYTPIYVYVCVYMGIFSITNKFATSLIFRCFCVFSLQKLFCWCPPLKGFGGFQEDSRSSSGGDEGLSPEADM